MEVAAVAEGVRKVFELDDGSVIVGEVIDEGKLGYLVRTPDGQNVRVLYSDIERTTILGAEPNAKENSLGSVALSSSENERSDRAGVRTRFSEAFSVSGGILFATGTTMIWTGIGVGAETNEELPGVPIVLGGFAQLITSTVFVGVGGLYARQAHRLYEPNSRFCEELAATSVILHGTGFLFVAIAGGILADNEWIRASNFKSVENSSNEVQAEFACIVISVVCLVSGHLFGQGYAAELRRGTVASRDASDLAMSAGNARDNRPQLLGFWLSPTPWGAHAGVAFAY